MSATTAELIRLGVPIRGESIAQLDAQAAARREQERLTAHRDLVTLCAGIYRTVCWVNPEKGEEHTYRYELGMGDDGRGEVWELKIGDEEFFLPLVRVVQFHRGDSAGVFDTLATAGGQLFTETGGVERRIKVVSWGDGNNELWADATQAENIARAVDREGRSVPNTIPVAPDEVHVDISGKIKRVSVRRMGLGPGTPLDLYRKVYLSIHHQIQQERDSVDTHFT